MDGYKKGFDTKNKLLWVCVNFSIDKSKMARFVKFKFLITLKLSFNGGQVYKEYKNFGYFKKLKKFVIKL